MVEYEVPFYSNTPDNTHCFQATLKMVLKYFLPREDYSWEELDTLTNKAKDLWTWPMAGMLGMKEKKFDVIDIEVFNYLRFVEEGTKYLVEFIGQEAAREQEEHSDIRQAQIDSEKFIQKIVPRLELPEQQTIMDYLDRRYLPVCLVNSYALSGKDGYAGHFVLIKGYKDNSFILHDPGLPPQENRTVDLATFNAAWAFPDDNAKNLMAFKLEPQK